MQLHFLQVSLKSDYTILPIKIVKEGQFWLHRVNPHYAAGRVPVHASFSSLKSDQVLRLGPS